MRGKYQRGEIYYADLGAGIGSEQSGRRPVVILQNNIGNRYSSTVIIAAITSRPRVKGKIAMQAKKVVCTPILWFFWSRFGP